MLFGKEKLLKLLNVVLLPILVSWLVCLGPAAALDKPSTATPPWRELPQPLYLAPADGAIYYSFVTTNGSTAHLVVINMNSRAWQLRPAVNNPTAPLSDRARAENASAAVNGGFFNLADGESTSFIVIDGKTVCDPHTNQALTGNPKLKPHLEQIFNRCELRVLEDASGQMLLDIQRHNEPPAQGLTLLHSLQGGPRLLPELTLKEEAFVRLNPDGTETDSIGSQKEAGRTAFGITADGYAMLICISGGMQQEGAKGMTVADLAALLKDLGCSKALNLDGGSSTSMYILSIPRKKRGSTAAPEDKPTGTAVCSRTPETRVKSVLLLLPAKR